MATTDDSKLVDRTVRSSDTEKQAGINLDTVICVLHDNKGQERDFINLSHFATTEAGKARSDADKTSLVFVFDVSGFGKRVRDSRIYGPKWHEDGISSPAAVNVFYLRIKEIGRRSFHQIRTWTDWEAALHSMLFGPIEGKTTRPLEIDFYVSERGTRPRRKKQEKELR